MVLGKVLPRGEWVVLNARLEAQAQLETGGKVEGVAVLVVLQCKIALNGLLAG